ncbi:DUF6924 domain-containing protein [Kitasatospora sp. NPDC059673]|uniref:DUF6924 domain-containing protein n=1 Tax=Kitasatospora sp. NPDC059673 TaxID=3346901 RepID=UPI0036738A36
MTAGALVVRTDFADPAAWQRLCEVLATPTEEGFLPAVVPVDDPAFSGLHLAGLTAHLPSGYHHPLLVLADRRALTDPELPLLVAHLRDPATPTVRVVATRLWSVENNLSISNLDFADYLRSTDPDGVHRGF